MNKHPLCSEVTGREIMWQDTASHPMVTRTQLLTPCYPEHSFSPHGNQKAARQSEKEARDQADLLHGIFPAATFSSPTFLPIINPSIY